MEISATLNLDKGGKMRKPVLKHVLAQLLPDPNPAFLPQWSVSKSVLGARLWSLKRHWWWPQYKGIYHLFQLSPHAENLR